MLMLPNMYDAAMDTDGQSLYLSIGTGLYRLDLNDDTRYASFPPHDPAVLPAGCGE